MTLLAPTATASLIGLLVAWVILYLLYKMVWPRDFGMPVRRRLICSHLHVERDQIAFVPLWWSDLQVHRALKAHWREALRGALGDPPIPA